MAIGNIRSGKRNYGRPAAPTTATANTSSDTTIVTISGVTASNIGPAITGYEVTAANTSGSTSETFTGSGGTVNLHPGGTYALSFAGRNYNGSGAPVTLVNSIVIPQTYKLIQTFNTSTTYTIPGGVTQIAAYVIGAGGGGGGGGARGYYGNFWGAGGGGGGSGAIVGFKDRAVTSGTTVTITVGTGGNGSARTTYSNNFDANGTPGNAGGTSKITIGNTDLATAGGGGGGGGASQGGYNYNSVPGNAGSAGSASSNVAGAITISGAAGGTGANTNNAAPNGTSQASTSNVTANNITAILPSNNAYGSGGGGATYGNGTNNFGTGAGGGGTGAAITFSGTPQPNPGTSATAVGAGGGGGAGATVGNSGGLEGSAGGNGYAGQVILYTY